LVGFDGMMGCWVLGLLFFYRVGMWRGRGKYDNNSLYLVGYAGVESRKGRMILLRVCLHSSYSFEVFRQLTF
jgi:hypothetical protein